MSIHGRIDMLVNRFLSDIITNYPSLINDLNGLLNKYLEGTQKFTYSDMKELIDALKRYFPTGILAGLSQNIIVEKLDFLTNVINQRKKKEEEKEDEDEEENKSKKSKKSKKEKILEKSRPSNEGDLCDFDSIKTGIDIISLYFYLKSLEYSIKEAKSDHITNLYCIQNEKFLEQGDLAFKELCKDKAIGYSIITPFFDTVESLNNLILEKIKQKDKANEKTSEEEKLINYYDTLKGIILNRSTI